jgi:HEPN domain-containing protein
MEVYNNTMIDVQKQVNFWRGSSLEDWQVAQELVDHHRLRHGLFFAQLAMEKLLKAHVCQTTQDLAPRIHNLIRLAEIANLDLNPAQIEILAEMSSFNIQGRYPDSTLPSLSLSEAQSIMKRATKVFQWLMNQLP